MELQKKKDFLIRLLYAAVILAIAIYICRRAVIVLLPFVIALLVSLILRPVVRFLHEKCRVQKTIASVCIVLLFYGAVGVLVVLLGIRLVTGVRDLVLQLPAFYNTRIEPLLSGFAAWVQQFATRFDPAAATILGDMLKGAGSSIESAITSFSMSALRTISSYAISAPGILIDILITIIATVFITMDYPLLKRFLLCQLSEKNRLFVHNIRVHLGRTLGRYVRSYALILLITFAELALGLTIIGIRGAPVIALLIACFDILPVVGSGTVLIPWAILAAVGGDYRIAASVGVLYIIVTVIRNIIEPKIVGDHVGLHPIATLVSMVVGVYVFGGIGLLGLPVTLALCKSLNDAGVIHIFRDPPPEESAEEAPDKKRTRGLFKRRAPEAQEAAAQERSAPEKGADRPR